MDAAKDPDIEETGTYTHYQVSEQALGVSKDSVDFEARKVGHHCWQCLPLGASMPMPHVYNLTDIFG